MAPRRKVDADRFLDSIIENIPDMIFVKDAKELRFVRFNRAGEELLGHSRKDLLGKNDYDFFPKAEADFFTKKDREVLKSGKLLDIPEEPIQTRKRGSRTLHTKKIPILDERGKALYLLGISEDITEKKDLQKKLVDESKMAAVGRLVAGIAHEIRNPLFGISAATQILTEAAPHTPELLEISRGIHSEIMRLRHLLDDLIMFSRQKKLRAESINPANLLEEILHLQKLVIEEKQLSLKTQVTPKASRIRVDPEQMHQVLLNLLVNAIQASQAGGEVLVESEVRGENGEWMFRVHNGGDWIEKKNLTQVFEPFFTTRADGSGLGLAITKRIVLDHGGRISVESSEESGTTFTVTIPYSIR